MAHQLQAIAVLLVLAAGARTQVRRPFSHKFHLALNLGCESCHKSASSSKLASDNLLPDPSACANCHDEVKIKAPRPSPVATFDHELHGRLRKTCASCHHGIEESEAPSAALFPAMAECLVCHTKIDPPDSCRACHAADMPLKPSNHAASFADTHTAKSLSKAGCALCHGRNFRCQGCH